MVVRRRSSYKKKGKKRGIYTDRKGAIHIPGTKKRLVIDPNLYDVERIEDKFSFKRRGEREGTRKEKSSAETFKKAREAEWEKKAKENLDALNKALKDNAIGWARKQGYNQKRLLEIQRMDVKSNEFKYLLQQVDASRKRHEEKAKTKKTLNKYLLGLPKNLSEVTAIIKKQGMPKFKPYTYEQIISIIQKKINQIEDKKKK